MGVIEKEEMDGERGSEKGRVMVGGLGRGRRESERGRVTFCKRLVLSCDFQSDSHTTRTKSEIIH